MILSFSDSIQNNFAVQKAVPDLTINYCTLPQNQLSSMRIETVTAAPTRFEPNDMESGSSDSGEANEQSEAEIFHHHN